jgi:Cys-rich protein (TIGR01571 family)
MNESETPYVKISPDRQGGFGDIHITHDRPQTIEMDTIQPTTSETETLTKSTIIPLQWSSLCSFDLESCFVSVYVPCHVVGKVGQKIGFGYPSLFLLYGFFFSIFNYCYYVFSYGITPVCPTNHYTDWCFLIYDKHECMQSYTKLNDKVLCNYNHDYHTCYATDSSCISEHEYTITWSSWCFLEIITLSAITGIHLYIRRSLKQKQKVPQDTKCKDLLYALYCSTCSLAQQYRALDTEENTIVEL